MIYCPKCGLANRDGSTFCNDCGQNLNTASRRTCPMCGTHNDANNELCEQCHARLVPIGEELDKTDRPDNLSSRDVALPGVLPDSEQIKTAPSPDDTEADEERHVALTRLFPQPATLSVSQDDNGSDASTHDHDSVPHSLPDWLQNPPEDLADLPSDDTDTNIPMPDWLRSGLTDNPSEHAADLPDWLRAADEIPAPPADAGDQSDLSPERADLPDWLKTLQPGQEKVVPEVATEPEDTSRQPALLAGVVSPLTVEPIIAMPHIVAPIQKVAVSEDARTGEMLRKLLSRRPAPAETVVPQKRFHPWQAAGYLILFLAVLVPLLSNSQLFNIEQSPAPSQAFFHTIEGLSSGNAVLMAFDYEADMMGDMQPQAEAILRHLRSRKVRIVATSTMPQGPYLAQQAWQSVTRKEKGVPYGKQFVNLGFLAGQEIGLRSLAQKTIPLDHPDFVHGEPLRNYAAVKGIRSLKDVRLIVLVGSNPEIIRFWLEQVGSHNPKIPIVAAVPAAVEPAVMPYYHSHQLAGVVTGLMGAVDYDLQTGRPPAGEASIDALTVGVLAALLLIGIGGIAAALGTGREGHT